MVGVRLGAEKSPVREADSSAMSDIAIRVETLSKLYRIGRAQQHDTLRDALSAVFRRQESGDQTRCPTANPDP